MTGPRAIVEAPAGLAAFSLAAHGGLRCRPPISRMGNKAGYTEALLGLAGITPGRGAGAYVWVEADPDVRGLLRAYPDPEMLMRVADIIRGWADEEPRALWERLRAERKARGPVGDAESAAGWMVAGGMAYRQGHPDTGYAGAPGANGGRMGDVWARASGRCRDLATYAQIASSNRLINVAGPDLVNTGKGGTTFGGAEFATPAGEVAAGFEMVAGWLFVAGNTRPGSEDAWKTVPVEAAQGANVSPQGLARVLVGDATMRDRWTSTPLSSVGWPPVAVLAAMPTPGALADLLGTPGDLEGVVIFSDPPYVGTTGYAADLPRADVVAFARGCAAHGAHVMVSEAEAIPELVAAGWWSGRIDHARRGQKRTFSKQQQEWVTMNREPAHVVPKQQAMFG